VLTQDQLHLAYGELPQRDLGQLKVVSGRVVACDALTLQSAEPFVQTVPPGSHPVRLISTAETPYAAAVLVCAPGRPVRWALAVTASDGDPDALAPDEVYGYPVGAGMGCFMDERATPLWEAETDAYDGTHYDDLIEDHLLDLPERDWANYVIGSHRTVEHAVAVSNPDALNIVLFRSGFGDGVYGTYAGLDEDGRLLCLLTDFAL
jgi:hypothetical protein